MDRRHFLRLAGLSAGCALAPPVGRWARAGSGVVFADVPAAQSGLTWVHENGMSPERYLPETCGSGCAFLDFDNDGWMDLYFVNSGPSDFYTPAKPIRNALYKNN